MRVEPQTSDPAKEHFHHLSGPWAVLSVLIWSFLWAWHLVSEPRGSLESSVTGLGRRRPRSGPGGCPGPVTLWAELPDSFEKVLLE